MGEERTVHWWDALERAGIDPGATTDALLAAASAMVRVSMGRLLYQALTKWRTEWVRQCAPCATCCEG